MFSIPSMKDLLKQSKDLVETYKKKRTEYDSQRMFASIRPGTINPERINYAEFIKNLAEHIDKIKFKYATFDVSVKSSSYEKEIAPFLKNVITGAMLLDLINITESYFFKSNVENKSALSKAILEIYGIDRFDDIPSDRLEKCLEDLTKYLNVFSTIQFHPSKSNEELLNKIDGHTRSINKSAV